MGDPLRCAAFGDPSAAKTSVLEALQALYSPYTAPAERDRASAWLVAFQEHPVAWEVANNLLSEYTETDVSVFGAQTLQRKVVNQLATLGCENLPAFRDALIAHTNRHSGPSARHVVVRQLALALALLVLRWPAWESPLPDCGSRLTSPAFHEFLKILAEEAQKGAGSASEAAMAMRARVSSWAPSVVQHLTTVSGSAIASEPSVGAPLLSQVMLAFAAWARLGCLSHLPIVSLQPLMSAAFQAAGAAGGTSNGWSAAAEASAIALSEVLERPPDGMEQAVAGDVSLLPSAGLRAAASGDVAPAAAVIHAFVQFCAGNLDSLLQEDSTAGAMREGLLRLSLLPPVDLPHPLAAPALEVVAALLERAAERRGRSASEEAIGAGVVSHLIAGVMPNIVLPENEADEAEPPGMSLRHAASEALAAASRFSGVSACSSEVENSIQRMRGQAEGREWQLVEVLLFGLSCCAEGAWGGGAPTCPPAEALRRVEAIGDAVSRVLPGAPSGARRLASLWHVRWLSATAEPMLRAGGPLEPHQALDLALRCLQTSSTVLRSVAGSAPEAAVSKLAVGCATAATELHRAMAKEGRLGEAESRVLRDAALEMYALADLQLAREDLQSQMMLVGASLTLARAVGSFGEAASRMLEPCERAMREAASLAVSEAPEASSLQSALQAAQQAVARINAVVRSVAPSDEEVESRGEQEAVLSYAVGILARCWPLVEQLILCRCEGAAELASSAGRAAAAAMRADGRAFLGALEGLLRTVLSALRRAEVLQEGVETATSLMRALSAAVEVFGGWNWGGGWAAMAADGGSDPEAAQRLVLSALVEVNRSPVVQWLAERKAADQAPEFAMATCAVDTSFARFCAPVLPKAAVDSFAQDLLQCGLLRAAACGPCNHKGASLAGLVSSSALIGCANKAALLPATLEATAAAGPKVMGGLLGSLVGTAPLGRLHKATSLVVELISFLARTSETPGAAAAIGTSWLSQALDTLPPGILLPGEKAGTVQEWGSLFAAIALSAASEGRSDRHGSLGASSGDYVAGPAGQRMKRALRAFIEKHSQR